MIRVFIADDHAIVRDGLRRLLAETPDMELAGETGKGREVLERVGDGQCDVLVLDLSLEDVGGIEVLRRLRAEAPKLPVIVLSMYSETQYAVPLGPFGSACTSAPATARTSSSGENWEGLREVAMKFGWGI